MAIWNRSRARDTDEPRPDPVVVDEPDVGTVLTHPPDPEPTDPDPDLDPPVTTRRGRLRSSLSRATPVTLLQSSHPKQAVLTALVLAGAAAASGRAAREVAVVGATVLVGQAVLGWHNDLVDREADARHGLTRKPLADDRVAPDTVWFALVVALLLVIPLSLSTGVTAGAYYLASLVVGILANVALRRGRFSWLPWAASFALYPAYLSHGGWGGSAAGRPPQVAVVVVAALLGVGVHVVRSVWGLVADDQDGWTYLPLALGRRLGATRLLVLSGTWTLAMGVILAVVGATTGLRA